MLRQFRVLILPALAALAWNVTPAYATTLTTYTDLASFNAATSGDTTIDFEGLTPPGTNTVYGNGAGVTVGNVDFIGYTSTGASLPVSVWDTSVISWANFGTNDAFVENMNYANGGAPPHIHVVFTMPVTAFGTNLFTTSSYGMPFAITLYGASSTQLAPPLTQTVTDPFPTTAFWGVTSDTPIYSADFTVPAAVGTGNTGAFLDNFTYGTADTQGPPPETPEAATMLLIGSGLLGLAILGKKMRPVQPA